MGHADYAVREEAKQTVAQFGAAALPSTLTLLRVHDTWLRVQVLEALEFCGWTGSRQWSAHYAHECAVQACLVPGPLAKAARPDLLQILTERPAADVANALAASGPEVIPLLQPALTHWNADVRTWAMFTVGCAAVLERRRYVEPAATNIDFTPLWPC